MKNKLFKKSVSIFLTVLMIMSCWVFVPGEHNHASAASLEAASALYNKSLLNGINTDIDTTMPTTMGKFKSDGMNGDENSAWHVSQYGSNHYKNIFYSPTVDINGYAIFMGSDVIPNIDSVRIYYPETVMLYDGSTKPQMGVVTCLDASNGNYIRALSVYLSANQNGLVLTDHWKGHSTGDLAHIVNIENGSYKFSNDGTEHSSYKINTESTGEWYFYASDIRFDGTLSATEWVRTITPSWGFYGARSYKSWGSWKYDTIQKFTQVASKNIYVMNIKGYRDLVSTIASDKANYINNAAKYTPESIKAYVSAANAVLNLNPKNVSQSPSAVKTWGSNMSTAYTNYVNAKNGLKNREYEVTYDNMFSLADWKYSASSEKANVTTDLTNGKVTVQNTNASGEYVTPHSGNSTNANTRNTNFYAMPVVGGQEYVFKYTTDHADTQMFAFFYDANGGHAGTYGAYNLTVKNGTGQATFKAPDNATQMEIRFDNNTGGTTANFWDIMIYPAAVKTENEVDTWTARPHRQLYTYNASVGTLQTPARPGYIFDGWKEDTDGDGIGDAAISGNVTKSRVLYSTWKPGTMDIGYDNLFSLSKWANSDSSVASNTSRGSIAYDLDAGTITAITTKDGEVYSNYGTAANHYQMTVKPGTEYIFTADVDLEGSGNQGQMFVFFYDASGAGVTGAIYNGATQSNPHIGLYVSNEGENSLTFTTPSDCTKIAIRVGATVAPTTAVYSNIGLFEKADYDAYAKDYEKVREPFQVGDTKNLMNPTREGFVFDGWELADGTKITTTEGLTANTTVYATWVKEYTVTYYYGDNTTVLATVKVKDGATVGSLPTVTPTKETTAEYSYSFAYWYANSAEFKADTKVTSDLRVYPVFNNVPHTFVWAANPYKNATCEEPALVGKSCSGCGYSLGNVPYDGDNASWLAKGHDYTRGEILANSSTGNTDNDTHSIKCARYSTCGSVELVKHTWTGDTSVGATCTTPGTIKKGCPCGAEKFVDGEIDANAHNFDYTTGTPNGDNKTHTVNCTYNAAHTETVSCKDDDNNCYCDICGQELVHVYDKKTKTFVKSKADCLNDAVYYYTCQCGKQGTETWTDVGSKLDHTFTNYVYNNDAKCGVDGTKTAECDTCDTGATHTITAEGTALEHNFNGEIKNNNDGTHSYKCTNEGCEVYGGTTDCTYGEWNTTGETQHVKTCSACSYQFKEDHSFSAWVSTDLYKEADGQHSKECSVCKKVVTEDCTYTEESFAETCTTDGFTVHTCNKCEHEYTTADKGKTGHNYTGTVKSYDNGYHNFLCKNGCKTYGFDGITNARTTCTYKYDNNRAGEHQATCTACNYTFAEECSGGQASCTTLKKCQHCNTEYGTTDPHSFTGTVVKLDGDKHAYLCEYCSTEGLYGVGAVENATEACSGGTATCIALAVCDKCNDTHGELAAHVYNGDAVKLDGDVHAYKCSVCNNNDLYGVGNEDNKTEACSGGKATCTDLAECTVCNDTHGELDKDAHKWGAWANIEGTETHKRACEYNNAHTETKDCFSPDIVVIAPDCETPGYTLNTCEICTHEWHTAPTEALGHDWSAWVNNEDGTHTRTCQDETCKYGENGGAKTETASCTKENAEAVVTEPTCLEGGYTTYTCKDCGYVWTDDETPATGHSYTEKTKKTDSKYQRSTKDCVTDWTYWYVCDNCDVSAETEKDKYENEADLYWVREAAAGHSFTAKTATKAYIATEATCTAKATYYYSCSVCGTSSEGTADEKTFEHGTVLGHDWVQPAEDKLADYLATPADCITDATYYYVCDRDGCGVSSKDVNGNTWTDVDSKAGHDFDYEGGYTEGVEANCTDAGVVEHYTCKTCGKHFKADQTTEIAADKLTIPALKHDYKDIAAKAATCEEDGYTKHKQCQREGCGYRNSDYKVVAALGHEFKAENGYYCDTVYNYHAYYCSRYDNCGAYGVDNVKYSVDMSGLDPEILGGIKCDFTGEYVNYEDANGVHSHKLTCVCGNVSSNVCADAEPVHVAPTCEEDGYYVHTCDVCEFVWNVASDAEEDKATGHDFEGAVWTKIEGKDKHIRYCKNGCGKSEVADCSTKTPATTCGSQNECDDCGAKFGEEIAHTWEEVEDADYLKAAATCETNAVYYKKCSGCDTQDETETWVKTGSKLGHSMTEYGYDISEWKFKPADFDEEIKEPTCNAEGLTISYCVRCDYYLTKYESKDESAHDYGEKVNAGGNCATGITYKQTCKNCGDVITSIDNNVDHEYVLQLSKAATCEEASVELYACKNCGFAKETHETEAKGHVWGEIVEDKAPTCKNPGRGYYICTVCSEKSEFEEIAKIAHAWDKNDDGITDADFDPSTAGNNCIYVEATSAKCSADGYEGYFKCLDCSYDQHLDGRWTSIEGNVKPATGHKDTDGDGECDGLGCDKDLSGNADDRCGCICHKTNWFSKIIYKILRFFWKLFGIGKSCDCGTVHY